MSETPVTIIQAHEGTVWLPTDPPRPCPEILSTEEAMVYLRLPNTKRGVRTMRYYQASGKLKGFRVGKEIKYRLSELQRFAKEQEEEFK